MFDDVEIDGKKFRMFFDKENFKLHIENDYTFKIQDFYKDKYIIKISNYILFIDTRGEYNSSSIEYNVICYIKSDYTSFNPENLPIIIFRSNKIAQLFYIDGDSKEYNYKIIKDNVEFEVSFFCSSRLNISNYYEVTNESCVKLKINTCKEWKEFYKIIQSILNCLSIIAVNRGLKKCDIKIYKDIKKYNIGEIKTKTDEKEDNDINYLGNVHRFKDTIVNIISTIYETPNINLNFIPKYFTKITYLDFFNLYSSFEYEYKFIDKIEMFTQEMRKNEEESKNMKECVLKTLRTSSLEITEHFNRYISNYNPLEGHKQKLINAYEYSKGFINKRLKCNGIIEREKEFIDYIYTTRIMVVHNPSDNYIIENMWDTSVFNEIVYGLFLKRCQIENSIIDDLCDSILIPVV